MAVVFKAIVGAAKWVFSSKSLAAVVARTATLAGLSAVTSKLAARDAAKGNTVAAGVEQQRQGGALVPRAIALGPCVVFGSELDLIPSGNADDNKFNWRALAVSDWPCRAGRIWVNAQPLTFAGDINAGWQACDQYRAKNGQPRLWMRFLTGAFDQAADAELLATGLWSSDDRLRGVAALLIKRQYDADAFPNGPPDANDLRIEVMDAPVYDWRDNTQSLTDVTTWKPSTNPVVLGEFLLCLARAPAQFNPGTTAPIVGPGLVWARRGGRDTFRAQLTTYANLCDALVGGVPRYRAALVARSDQTGEELMQLLANACGGDWISGPAGGMLVPGHVPAPVRTIPVGEYVAGQPISFDPYEAPDQAVNTLNITGPDLDRAGELDTMTVSDIDDVLADGGERAQGLDLSAVPWAEQRWRVGWRKYRLARLSERRQIPVRPRHRDLIPGDVILAPDATLPTTPVDMSAAWWQVTGAQESVREDGHWVALPLQRVAASVDGPVPEMGATADFDPPPLAPELAVPVIAVAAAPEVAGTAITPRWRITLDETGVQTRARVMVQGPATTAGAIGSAVQRLVDVARGVPALVPSGPGWWRWRASGLDAAGRQGPWGAWSSAVQETQEVVSAVAAAVNWPDVRDTNPAQPRPENGATVGARIGSNLLFPDSAVVPLERVDNRFGDFSARAGWRFAEGTQGWSVVNATLSHNGVGDATAPGYIVVTSTSSDPILWLLSGFPAEPLRAPRVRARVRCTSHAIRDLAWDGSVFFSTPAHGQGPFGVGIPRPDVGQNEWVVLEWNMLAAVGTDFTTAALTSLRLDLTAQAGVTFHVGWIVVGDNHADPVGARRIEDGADVTATAQRAIVPQFPVIEIKAGEAGHTGTRSVTHSVRRGTNTLSGGSWSLPSTNVSGATITINSSTGTVEISGVTASGAYTVRYTHTDGIATDLPVNVTYLPAAASGGGRRNFSEVATGINSASYTTVLSTSITDAAAGNAEIRLEYLPTSVGGGGPTNFQMRLTRNGVQVVEGTAFLGIDGAGDPTADWLDGASALQGFYNAASGTATWALQVRRTSGSGRVDVASGLIVVDQQPT